MATTRSIGSINLACGEFPKRCDECLRTFDVQAVRREFPILATRMNGKPLAYLDNSATTQKPRQVIDAIRHYYEFENANIHRGVYKLSQDATAAYEQAREKLRAFINAPSSREIIFTRGATEAINLVASSYSRAFIRPGDEILISAMEHHSNIVPWQMAAEMSGAKLRVIPINDRGELVMDEFVRMLSPRVKLVAIVYLSNVLGTINPVQTISAMAHEHGARVLVDAAQWVGHFPTDVQEIGCDFFALSGHKMFGPTGTGALWGREELLDEMPPYQGGGDMIETVTFEETAYADLPSKFEAGTPNIAGGIALGAAVDFLNRVGLENLIYYEHGLLRYAEARLREVPGLRVIGEAVNKSSVISFVMERPPIAPMDIGAALDRSGIAVRTGHHCCMPLMHRMSVSATTRASLAFYNTVEEIDRLVETLLQLQASESQKATVHKPAPSAQIAWPEPVSASPAESGELLIEAFELLGDWEQRDAFILEMGEKIPAMPEHLKKPESLVHGCMSTVHMVGRLKPGTESAPALDIVADSDAHLVRGLIGLLQRVYSGQPVEQILSYDITVLLRRLGLDKHLSMGRRSGLEGMIKRIRLMARALRDAGSIPPEFTV